ncbi:MAG: methionyl-tRNA formyltransferase [Halioglobus sp.]|jgi:methionyl-tRNA formyltransferase
MNVTVLANRDLASNFALNRLLPALKAHHKVSVFLSSRVGGNTQVPIALQQLAFFEQALFNELLFPALAQSGKYARLQSFDALAHYLEMPIVELNKINSEQGLETLAASQPDLILSLRYGGILRESAIAASPLGVLNLHSGLLPDYRGVMATFYAMLNGEQKIGTTLHSIQDAGIDTGDVLGQTHIELDYSRSYLWNVLQLYPAGLDLMLSAVDTISRGETLASQMQPEAGTYYSFPGPAQLQAFEQKGHRLYDVQEIIEFAKQYLES